jgi:glycine/sarcosine N-methyltransferase
MPQQCDMKKVANFYDQIARSYDGMTSFNDRLIKERKYFQSILKNYSISTAIDAGAGTGFHSILLASLGVDVTAVDISQNMLHNLTQHAREMNLTIKTRRCGFTDLRNKFRTPTDAVFCMGNSLAHLLTRGELQRSIRNFHEILNPGGILVVQILNYNRILKQKERILNVRESGGKTFVRFYDFLPKNIRFNILTIDRNISPPEHQLQSVELRPIQAQELRTVLYSAGFSSLRIFGNIQRHPFVSSRSSDIIIFATKR